jgi:hypothetical protein
MAKATIAQVKEFFGGLANKEILELKKADANGWDQLATGIGDGSLTY